MSKIKGSAFPRQTKNLTKMVAKTVSNIKSILRRLWGGFGDGFGEDFGGVGRSWGGKRETGRKKKRNRKTQTDFRFNHYDTITVARETEKPKENLFGDSS